MLSSSINTGARSASGTLHATVLARMAWSLAATSLSCVVTPLVWAAALAVSDNASSGDNNRKKFRYFIMPGALFHFRLWRGVHTAVWARIQLCVPIWSLTVLLS